MLNIIEHGQPTDKPGLLIVHGLYGSGRNWGVIAKRLSDERQVVAVDMRNHGYSDWQNSHTYHDLAGDLAGVLQGFASPFDVLGHSMGGKASMVLAVTKPSLVNRLIVADIAPVAYRHTQMQYIDAMKGVDLGRVQKRSDAEEQLKPLVDDPALASFFTQSLDVAGKKWRLNLDVLAAEMPHILSFPELDGAYEGPTLFLSGANSDYVKREYRDEIKRLFPNAGYLSIKNAGHWLHAEQPRAFEQTLRAWLNR